MVALPIIIVNFKTYKDAVGPKAVVLAKKLAAVAKKERVSLAVAVAAPDIAAVAKAVRIPVLAQHVEALAFGAHTGHLPAVLARKEGAAGTLLNHSEHKLDNHSLQAAIDAAHAAGLWVCACAATAEEVAKVASFGPEMVAVEPPELIGGDVSVATAKPQLLVKARQRVGRTPLLCGAGVHSAEDVHIALTLGLKGILVAHAITGAKNPGKALKQLIEGMR